MCLWLHDNFSGKISLGKARRSTVEEVVREVNSSGKERKLADCTLTHFKRAFTKCCSGHQFPQLNVLFQSCSSDPGQIIVTELVKFDGEMDAPHPVLDMIKSILVEQENLVKLCLEQSSQTGMTGMLLNGARCQEQEDLPLNLMAEFPEEGLVQLTRDSLKRLMAFHAKQESAEPGKRIGRWKLNLHVMEQLVVRQYLMNAQQVKKTLSSIPFFLFSQPEREYRHLEALLPKLSPQLQSSLRQLPLRDGDRQRLVNQLRTESYRVIMRMIEALTLLSNTISSQLASNNDILDSLKETTLAEFARKQWREAFDDHPIKLLCFPGVYLKHIESLFKLCVKRLDQEEVFFQDCLPPVVSRDLDASLDADLGRNLEAFSDLVKREGKNLVYLLSKAISCTQAVLPVARENPSKPLVKLLQEVKGSSLPEHLVIPVGLCGCHLKEVIVRLQKMIRQARFNLLSIAESSFGSLGHLPASSMDSGRLEKSENAPLLLRSGFAPSRLSAVSDESHPQIHPALRYSKKELEQLSDKISLSVQSCAAGVSFTIPALNTVGVSKAPPVEEDGPRSRRRMVKCGTYSKKFLMSGQGIMKNLGKHFPAILSGGETQLMYRADEFGYILQDGEDVPAATDNCPIMWLVRKSETITVRLSVMIFVSEVIQETAEITIMDKTAVEQLMKVILRHFKVARPVQAVIHDHSGRILPTKMPLSDVLRTDPGAYGKSHVHAELSMIASDSPSVLSNMYVKTIYCILRQKQQLSVNCDLWPDLESAQRLFLDANSLQVFFVAPLSVFKVVIVASESVVLNIQVVGSTKMDDIKKQLKVNMPHSGELSLSLKRNGPLIPLHGTMSLWQCGVHFGTPITLQVTRCIQGNSVLVAVCKNPTELSGEVATNPVSIGPHTTVGSLLEKCAGSDDSLLDDAVLLDSSTECTLPFNCRLPPHILTRPGPSVMMTKGRTLYELFLKFGLDEKKDLHPNDSTLPVGITAKTTASQLLCHLGHLKLTRSRNITRVFCTSTVSLMADMRLCQVIPKSTNYCNLVIGSIEQSRPVFFRLQQLGHPPLDLVLESDAKVSGVIDFAVPRLLPVPVSWACSLKVGQFNLPSYSSLSAGALKTRLQSTACADLGGVANPICCNVVPNDTVANLPAGVEHALVRIITTGAEITNLYLPVNTHDIMAAIQKNMPGITGGVDLFANGTPINNLAVLGDLLENATDTTLCLEIRPKEISIPIVLKDMENEVRRRSYISLPKSTPNCEIWKRISQEFNIDEDVVLEYRINGAEIERDSEDSLEELRDLFPGEAEPEFTVQLKN